MRGTNFQACLGGKSLDVETDLFSPDIVVFNPFFAIIPIKYETVDPLQILPLPKMQSVQFW